MIYWRKYFIIILGILFNIELSPAQHSDTSKVLLSKLELQFTNRFYYVRRYKIRDSSIEYKDLSGIYRIQFGYDVWKQNYFHLFYDFHYRRVDLDLLGKNFIGHAFGIQYNKKFNNHCLFAHDMKRKKRTYPIYFFPEFIFNYGYINLFSNYNQNSLDSREKFSHFYTYGVGLTFYLDNISSVILLYQNEYYPSIKIQPYDLSAFQLRAIIKL